MRKVLSYIGSPVLMGLLALILVVSCALATFVENDFGTQAARVLVYNAFWFELVLVLLALNLLSAILVRRLYRLKSLPVFLFHLGFVVIILGAGVTRYKGVEGMLHLREGEVKHSYQSADRWVKLYANNELVASRSVLFSTVGRNRLKLNGRSGIHRLKATLEEFIPRGEQAFIQDPEGNPLIMLMILDQMGSHPALIPFGESISIGGSSMGFQSDLRTDVSFALTDTGLVARSLYPVSMRQMTLDSMVIVPVGEWFSIEPKVFYRMGSLSFAFRDFFPSARVVMVPSADPASQSPDILRVKVCVGSDCDYVYVPHTESMQPVTQVEIGGMEIALSYSPREISLPFGLKLNKFVLERYPGSESPSSYISNVEVIDSLTADPLEYSIYMNNILKYRGVRLFQSSYDPDLKGTYLSVNDDRWGTAITYIGYFLLILGMLLALFAPGTRFRRLLAGRVASILVVAVLMGLTGGHANANVSSDSIPSISKAHASSFGHVAVQDHGGRTKPISTLAGETLRKLNRSNRFMGQAPEQILLGMSSFPEVWQSVPVVQVKNPDIQRLLGITSELASFTDFFNYQLASGSYKLSGLAQQALSISPSQRTAMEKEVLKIDERVNILFMILSGQMARIFPEQNHPQNLWHTMGQAAEWPDTTQVGEGAGIFADYIAAVRNASRTGSWSQADDLLASIILFQHKYGSEIIPSDSRVRAEVILNRFLPFERLIPWYGITGLIMLILSFVVLTKRIEWHSKPRLLLMVILISGFAIHTIAIAMRWYVAGRAPLSNSYETMVYISWAAMLGGLVFSKRSLFALPASALLSTLVLFVAHLSWMDPQITNLVPVLKSYWLTIHVAVITASYGFFGMGAILGLLVMALYAMQSKDNSEQLQRQIKELTVINELGLTLGLYLLTAGCFLGAVWANESWGRYWGWDPKETWTLITIVVYAFILHMRLIPGLYSHYSFSFAAILAIGSVLMTYFGVNYYLSGLHSYAGGDSLPLPSWLLAVVVGILALGIFAWYRKKRIGI